VVNMTETGKRYRVGAINPTQSGDSFVELEPLLPGSVELVRSALHIHEQTEAEFISVLDETAARVDDMAAQHVDLIHPIGAPVFMVHGYAGERDIVSGWEQKHGIPIFTSGQSHVNSMRALGITRFVGLSPLSERINEIAANYFSDAGFDVLAFVKAKGPENDRRMITWQEAYAQARDLFEANPAADGIYFISSGWRILEAVPALERDLGVPVDHPITARVWEIQRRLGLKEPLSGYGKLLEELPPAV
jgi:maleate cis-trans isomerase